MAKYIKGVNTSCPCNNCKRICPSAYLCERAEEWIRRMDKIIWKSLAIIFIVLFVVETLLLGWGVMLVNEEEEQTYVRELRAKSCIEFYIKLKSK